MEEQVTYLELIVGVLSAIVTAGIAVFTGWLALNIKVTKMDSSIEYLKEEDGKLSEQIKGIQSENHRVYNLLDKKLDHISESITDINLAKLQEAD